MSAFKDEMDLAQYLEDMLRPNFKEVYANVNLASHKFYDVPNFVRRVWGH